MYFKMLEYYFKLIFLVTDSASLYSHHSDEGPTIL